MSRRLLICTLLVFSLFRIPAKADEGMWLPFLIDDALFAEMQEMGLRLTRDQIFSFTESSLKDAIVYFGGGCTAEMISSRGLLLTNHHCGYSRIQSHSTVENDLLYDGFWAESLEEELPNPGLVVMFLVRAEDVTSRVLSEVFPGMSEKERITSVNAKITEIINQTTRNTHYTAVIRPMFAGNEYFMFVYETYNDVRLVGTPPESIGSYGGDTDNWMWPRHTGDFSLFRVYTGPDGKPAEYSPENIPLKPRHYLPVSLKGVNENDFAMILGYPGNTTRYLTSYGIDFSLENIYPVRIDIRRKKLDVIEKAMASDHGIRIKYASKQSGIANYWKNFIGMSRSLRRLKVADTKKSLEVEFEQWVRNDAARKVEYGSVLDEFRQAYDQYRQFYSQNYVFLEAMASGPDLLRIANSFDRLSEGLQTRMQGDELLKETDNLRNMAGRSYRNYDAGVDQQLWAAMFRIYHDYVPASELPDIFGMIEKKYNNNFEKYAADVYRKSVFADPKRLNRFLDKPSARVLRNDPVFQASRSVYGHSRAVTARMQDVNARVSRAERLFLKGLREMKSGELFYPDANGTMRLTYGKVAGYNPADAVHYAYHTSLNGVMEKEDPNHHEFIVPEKLKASYEAADYGRYGHDDNLVVNFITNNDITGGNSGSPVINGEGHLIGLAFDGNWEAMSGDILFENLVQRTISVDVRYILFVIETFSGNTRLIDEMTIIE